jgi:hypothetical protein
MRFNRESVEHELRGASALEFRREGLSFRAEFPLQ